MMVLPTTPSIKEVMKGLGLKDKAKAKTAGKLLAFIECIPPSMRVPMRLAMTTLFDEAHDWRLSEPKTTIGTIRDEDVVLRKAILFI